jgi:hypothetical protein
LACLLYCVTPVDTVPAREVFGVGELPVQVHEALGMRVLWSEIATPEALLEGPSRKIAEQKVRQVLREVVAVTSAIAVPFPAMVADADALDTFLTTRHDMYSEALTRLAGLVQLELTASWAADEQSDLAKPISGREYQLRHQEAEARFAAIDSKLKSVTAGIVREWRSRQERRNRVWVALLARGDRERFIAALRSAGPSEGVRLRLSGPFPPNEFVSPSV